MRLRERRTQKLMSRLLLPPCSLSPVWNVTVILSPLRSCSKKHSLECARRRMLCADVAPIHPSAATRNVEEKSRIVCTLKVAQLKITIGIRRNTRAVKIIRDCFVSFFTTLLFVDTKCSTQFPMQTRARTINMVKLLDLPTPLYTDSCRITYLLQRDSI